MDRGHTAPPDFDERRLDDLGDLGRDCEEQNDSKRRKRLPVVDRSIMRAIVRHEYVVALESTLGLLSDTAFPPLIGSYFKTCRLHNLFQFLRGLCSFLSLCSSL